MMRRGGFMSLRPVFVVILALSSITLAFPQSFTDSPAERDARLKWWREARFGMFIHWGVYSVPAGEWQGKLIPGIGEWIMNRAKIPVTEYEKLAGQFNPVKFNADEWVRLAKAAGQRYIVITSNTVQLAPRRIESAKELGLTLRALQLIPVPPS